MSKGEIPFKTQVATKKLHKNFKFKKLQLTRKYAKTAATANNHTKMNTTLSNQSDNQTLRKITYFLGTFALLSLNVYAQNSDLPTFSDAMNQDTGDIGSFFGSVTKVMMYVMAVVSVVITVLAFKGLAGQGDWRAFWNKIAGAIGMFAVPAIMNWLITAQ